MGNLLPLITQLISGAVGGNVAGSLMKKLSLGTLGNSIVGILGGGLGGQIRYSIQVNNNIWDEVGEYSRDGQTWFKFFKMHLRKQPTNVQI